MLSKSIILLFMKNQNYFLRYNIITTSFPLQKKRYLRFQKNTTSTERWTIDEINLLAPIDLNGALITPHSNAGRKKIQRKSVFPVFNLLGKTK